MAIWNKNDQEYLVSNKTLFEAFMLADKDGNIINTFGEASNIPLAAGELDGYSAVHKFGIIDGTIGTGWSTIWTQGENNGDQLVPWREIGDAGVVTVTSSLAGDTTGVTLEGLDANYNFQSETLTLAGTADVVGTKTWHRINRMYMVTETNVGNVTATIGADIVSSIKAERGQTLQAFYTVPAGKTAYLTHMQVASNKNQAVESSLFVRPFGGAFRVTGGTMLYQMEHSIHYTAPIRITEKSDMDFRAIGAANGVLSASFDLILVDNTA